MVVWALPSPDKVQAHRGLCGRRGRGGPLRGGGHDVDLPREDDVALVALRSLVVTCGESQ